MKVILYILWENSSLILELFNYLIDLNMHATWKLYYALHLILDTNEIRYMLLNKKKEKETNLVIITKYVLQFTKRTRELSFTCTYCT